MKRRGRPPRQEKNRKVLLQQSVFDQWNQRKNQLGFHKKTHSQFAAFLLDLPIPSTQSNMPTRNTAVDQQDLDMSPIVTRPHQSKLFACLVYIDEDTSKFAFLWEFRHLSVYYTIICFYL